MNRGELVGAAYRALVGNGDLPADVIDAILGAVLRVVVQRAAGGQKTSFNGMGYFCRAEVAEREYMNPRTREPLPAAEKKRLIFVPSGHMDALFTGGGVGRPKMQHGRAELMQAALRACDSLDEPRQRMLNNAGVLCRVCDGKGEAGLGAWVFDESGGWLCASGNPPFLTLDADLVAMALDYLEAAIKVAMFKGGVVDVRGFGVWYVRNMPAKVRRVPLWDGGSVVVNCLAKKVVSFSPYVRL